MYWTDSGLDKIERARLDGSERKVLFHTDLVNPRAITVDPIRGLAGWLYSLDSPVDLFWSLWLLYMTWEGLDRPEENLKYSKFTSYVDTLLGVKHSCRQKSGSCIIRGRK